MNERYSRNRLYVNNSEQSLIKNYPILLAGCGIGSNIAECALRFGFENITLIDGDIVETSNLNRQNFTEKNLQQNKAETLYKRLKEINPEADIKYITEFIDDNNVNKILKNIKIAFNALDFTSDIPIVFDEIAQKKGIPVIHPYNLGWGGLVTAIHPNGKNFQILGHDKQLNELKVVEFVMEKLAQEEKEIFWLHKVVNDYKNEKETLPPPQLSVGSWLVAGMCTTLLYKIVTQKKSKYFPEFYFKTIVD
ncbi:ThiF family adenylyltransferase [Chryseobacterium mucoviscidosis]|uniref:ThiF family adenylyltransferase n=1 Tax=Chryseobacterium mucoviscidosis TaxID=1945581 RepID=UPI003016F8CD